MTEETNEKTQVPRTVGRRGGWSICNVNYVTHGDFVIAHVTYMNGRGRCCFGVGAAKRNEVDTPNERTARKIAVKRAGPNLSWGSVFAGTNYR